MPTGKPASAFLVTSHTKVPRKSRNCARVRRHKNAGRLGTQLRSNLKPGAAAHCLDDLRTAPDEAAAATGCCTRSIKSLSVRAVVAVMIRGQRSTPKKVYTGKARHPSNGRFVAVLRCVARLAASASRDREAQHHGHSCLAEAPGWYTCGRLCLRPAAVLHFCWRS